MWLFMDVIKTQCVKNHSLDKKWSYLKELLGECFTCTLHGIHENDEGLSVKFDTIVMQGLFDMKYECLLCFKLHLGHYHNVQWCQIVIKAYLQLCIFGKVVMDMENSFSKDIVDSASEWRTNHSS